MPVAGTPLTPATMGKETGIEAVDDGKEAEDEGKAAEAMAAESVI